MEELKLERVRNRLLYCPVCLDEYNDPRWLPCLHTICNQCLEQLKTSSNGIFIQCPECRASISSHSKFPVNFLINCLKEEIEAPASPKLCDVCAKGFNFAKYYCERCNIDLCGSCAPEHSLFNHMFYKKDFLVEKASYPKLKINNENLCPIHIDESQQMYCKDCEQALCVQCYHLSHKKHKTIPLKQMEETLNNNIYRKLVSFIRKSDEVDVGLMELNYMEEDITRLYDLMVDQIHTEKALLLQAIESKTSQEIDYVRTMQKEALASVQSYRNKMQDYSNNIKRAENVFRKTHKKSINMCTVKSFNTFLKQMEKECEQLQKAAYKIKKPKFLKNWRLKIEPFLWIFLGYTSFASFYFNFFPDWQTSSWIWKILKNSCYILILIFISCTICQLSMQIYQNGFRFDMNLALIMQVYFLINLLLCRF